MKRGVIYPEDSTWSERRKGCQLALAFGLQRGRRAAYHVQQDRLNTIPFDTPEKMAYFRGYNRGYAQAIKNVRPELRRKKHGT